MSAKTSYSYTDAYGAHLALNGDRITITVLDAGLSFTLPAGKDGVDLARAILAAGDSGYEAVSPERMEWRLRIAGKNCARDMRERAVAVAGEAPNHPHQWPAVAIRALPLLPEEDESYEE